MIEVAQPWNAPGDLPAAFQYLKGAYKELEGNFLQGSVVIGQGGMDLN